MMHATANSSRRMRSGKSNRRRCFMLAACAVFASACGGNTASTDAPGKHLRTTISAIQGPGTESPLVGRMVTVTALVSGDFQDHDDDTQNNLGGFFLQSEQPDRDENSSEGLFVFDDMNIPVDVSVGQRVTVTGVVQEFFGETQIKASHVQIEGRGEVQPLQVEMPWPLLDTQDDAVLLADLERYEGMLLQLPQTLTVSDLYGLERFGELQLALGGRPMQFSNEHRPDPAAYLEHRRQVARQTIVLDDGLRISNPRNIRYQYRDASANSKLRVGDTVSGVVGNLRYARGAGAAGAETWRLMPTRNPRFIASNPRTPAPAREGNLRVASFNVLNYFSKTDNKRKICGPASTDACRGADSAQELERQLAKIVTALALIDADIVGLIELENNSRQSLEDIVDALNARLDSDDYTFINTGTIGRDAIKTGLLYKPAAVRPSGEFALLESPVDARFNDRRNRPALMQTFRHTGNGAQLSVVVNHLKSKGSDCVADNDPNTGDGQGNCNRTRTLAAAALLDWLASDPTASKDPDILLLGDLNAYRMEDPLLTLETGGFVNLLSRHDQRSWSFVYDGQSGTLDHALASPGLLPQVVNALAWHINADEAPLYDYNLEHDRDPTLFDPMTPYRSSDHDPIIVDLQLR